MPYIKQERRAELDPHIQFVIDELKRNGFNEGDINYVVSKICNAAFAENKSYATINKVMGVLQCASAEFYRRKAIPYEENKILDNGDLSP